MTAKIEQVHINSVRAGDTVIHLGKTMTVCKKDLTTIQGMGRALFGDTYALGFRPVSRLAFTTLKGGDSVSGAILDDMHAAPIERGFGHHGAIRVGDMQAVRPMNSETWDLFKAGHCIETGMTETDARARQCPKAKPAPFPPNCSHVWSPNMPEFILDGRDHAARAESDFVLGFIEAMFFTESGFVALSDWFKTDQDERISGGALPCDVGYTHLHPDSLAAIRTDCQTWRDANAALLSEAYATGYNEAQAGRDYWFTRNGHGVGFWDREELRVYDDNGDSLGDKLSDACRYNEVNPFFGDHVEHGKAPFVHVDL